MSSRPKNNLGGLRPGPGQGPGPPAPEPRSRAGRARAEKRPAPAWVRRGSPRQVRARKAPGTARAASGLLASGVPEDGCDPPDLYGPQRFSDRASRRRAAPLLVRGPPSDSKADQGGAAVPQRGWIRSKDQKRGDTTRNLKADVPARESTAPRMAGGAFLSFPGPSSWCYRRSADGGTRREPARRREVPGSDGNGGRSRQQCSRRGGGL